MIPHPHPVGTSRFVALVIHPMFLVVMVGLVLGNTAVWTLYYDPRYLPYSELWSVAALTGSLASFMTVRWMNERVAVVTGAIVTLTAFARAFANAWQSVFGSDVSSNIATIRVGAGVWFLLSLLIYAMWTRLVLPWIVLSRRETKK